MAAGIILAAGLAFAGAKPAQAAQSADRQFAAKRQTMEWTARAPLASSQPMQGKHGKKHQRVEYVKCGPPKPVPYQKELDRLDSLYKASERPWETSKKEAAKKEKQIRDAAILYSGQALKERIGDADIVFVSDRHDQPANAFWIYQHLQEFLDAGVKYVLLESLPLADSDYVRQYNQTGRRPEKLDEDLDMQIYDAKFAAALIMQKCHEKGIPVMGFQKSENELGSREVYSSVFHNVAASTQDAVRRITETARNLKKGEKILIWRGPAHTPVESRRLEQTGLKVVPIRIVARGEKEWKSSLKGYKEDSLSARMGRHIDGLSQLCQKAMAKYNLDGDVLISLNSELYPNIVLTPPMDISRALWRSLMVEPFGEGRVWMKKLMENKYCREIASHVRNP